MGLLIVVPLTLLFGAELALRVASVGYPTRFFIESDTPGMLEPNPDFARQYFGRKTAARPTPFKMPEHKARGTQRIFVLGESAAAGTPDPAFAFSRILEVMLRAQFPQMRFEVFNVAMRGIDSPVVRDIARECARYEPDLFVVYVGNNDVIGLHGAEPGVSRWSLNLARQRFTQVLKSTRLGQWLFRRSRGAGENRNEQSMEYFRAHRLPYDDWSRSAVVQNYSANLHDIVWAARRAGAKVALATLPVNVRNFPPLGSLPRAGLSAEDSTRWTNAFAKGIEAASPSQWSEAIRQFDEAARIDDHPAELQFRLGEACAAAGDTNQARAHFLLALDRDALQFRADSRVNAVIRQFAASATNDAGIRLVETERAFSASPLADLGLAGDRLFNDHVHPSFAGDYLLASLFCGAAAHLLGLTGATNALAKPLPELDECARTLAFTPWDERNVEGAMVNFKSRPPHLDQADHARRQRSAEASLQQKSAQMNEATVLHCAEIYRAAVDARPDDWLLRLNFGRLLLETRQPADAAVQLEAGVKLQPRAPQLRLQLADALAQTGRVGEALRQLDEAKTLAPDDAQIPRLIARLQMASSPFGAKSGAPRNPPLR